MKKLFIASLILMMFASRIEAQVDHDYNPNDAAPGPEKNLRNKEVSPTVLKVMLVDFKLDKP
jgi:hypothetical protein